ncbi:MULTISPECIES: efflux RND transporter permease subunit [Clostridium]|uniref:Multidrug resistance protein MdtC n=2 Tax=Clostridium TaxID=1485 RepID=D8GL27_CLOLD|nr:MULTISPECIES: efflux RND transporter permease subunit [Clostridium]ADK15386.1 predicted cation/multidrug efflux pump [Clostridium ljungdahlii DSM 13528]ALU34805.1 RND-type efflux system membrane permease AcrB family [Clostridium autoethanogenum DSM 10061]OAA88486.1 Multidrug resistance protein MdtC [Clostridium ljungdahlii DSM 13528]OVY51524.1 Multidrug resistance protein MdtC [Clostridium autoethanogenum]RMD02161.1 efflux RND transporter permease subunit [Clostridium autoethanogenum]
MNLTELSVKKPAAITMVILFLLGLGIFGYTHLGADLMPSMDIPVISISTTYSGASSEDIRKDVVKPMEDAVAGISGIDRINSTAREGMGQTTIIFKSSANMNTAFLDVQKAVDNAQGKLPKNADKPILFKLDTGAMSALMLSVSGNLSYDELYNEANTITEALKKVQGVGNVSLEGIQKKQLIIKLNKSAIEFYGINLNTLTSKLQSDNINMPAGQIKQDKLNQSVRVISKFESVDEVKNLLIPTSGNSTVRLGDIADVNLEYPEQDQRIRMNGKNTIGISIQKQSDANVVEVVNNVKKEIAGLKKDMPSNIRLDTAYDSTTFINSSISQIKHTLIEGVITTALVLLIFLKSWRSSLVILVAIPTSLISTFFMMYVMKFTMNIMSLMGLSLCVGTLVDDSIVVLDNIQRHLAMKKDPQSAAIDGRKEIGLASIAITLCDVVVYLPVCFMTGMVGTYFREFGLTIVFASLFSLFVAFTITPMLSSRLLKTEENRQAKSGMLKSKFKQSIFYRILNGISSSMDSITANYKRFLIWCLDHRKRVLALGAVVLVATIALIPIGAIGTELMPTTDESNFSISMSFDSGTSLNEMDKKVKQVENYLHSVSEVSTYYSMVGSSSDSVMMDSSSNSASMYVTLYPKNDRKRSQTEVAKQVRKWGNANLAGTDFSVSESEAGGSGSSKPISIEILGDNTDTVTEISNKVEQIVKGISGITDVDNSTNASQSELRVKIDKLAAAQYGVSISDISSTLRTAIQGSSAGTYSTSDDDYDIKVKFHDGDIKTPSDISGIKVLNQSGQSIPISEVASIVRTNSPQSISRKDRQDVATISANIEGRSLGTISQQINEKLKSLSVPEGYKIQFGGDQKSMGDSFTSLGEALGVSLILIYMILVVLYESFLTPFIRMLSLPCALVGAFGILAITGKTLNMMSLIGLIMLDGLASKNGTLLIDYTNTLIKRGYSLREALIESGERRLRPIMMTSLTMIVGMLPAALSIGEGSELKSSMAVLVIGGMIASTIFTPIILPIIYLMMDNLKNRIFKKRKKQPEMQEV